MSKLAQYTAARQAQSAKAQKFNETRPSQAVALFIGRLGSQFQDVEATAVHQNHPSQCIEHVTFVTVTAATTPTTASPTTTVLASFMFACAGMICDEQPVSCAEAVQSRLGEVKWAILRCSPGDHGILAPCL